MTRLAVWAAVLALAPAARGANPDPKSLAIPAGELDRARQLAGKLGDTAFPVREQATRELLRMGRLALPVVEQTLTTAADPEVQARCAWLLPKALAADQKARLDTFLADAAGKYDHDLPGWNELMKATGNTPAARELFVDMLKVKANADLFAAVRHREAFAPRLLARRAELYNRLYRFTPDGRREPPAAPEVAALILAEVANTTPLTDRRFQYAPFSAAIQPVVRQYMEGPGKGEAFRKLIAHWLDTRTEVYELSSAMNTASVLNLKEVRADTIALRVIQSAGTLPYARMQALAVIAKSGDESRVKDIRQSFEDKGATNLFRNGINNRVEVRVGDVALAMAIVLTKQNPGDYGFDVQSSGEATKYSWSNFTFASDERRKYAFVKWAFWEARQKK